MDDHQIDANQRKTGEIRMKERVWCIASRAGFATEYTLGRLEELLILEGKSTIDTCRKAKLTAQR